MGSGVVVVVVGGHTKKTQMLLHLVAVTLKHFIIRECFNGRLFLNSFVIMSRKSIMHSCGIFLRLASRCRVRMHF